MTLRLLVLAVGPGLRVIKTIFFNFSNPSEQMNKVPRFYKRSGFPDRNIHFKSEKELEGSRLESDNKEYN